MGPTGAGKSTFIEVLAGNSQKLAISSNQLAGFTQHVTAYRLVNVQDDYEDYKLYLVDTPGSSDSKISEIEVMEMLRDWLKENSSAECYKILFLTPITAARLPGSRRRTIKILRKSLVGMSVAVAVITTMWDTLHNEQTHIRAEQTFEQLRDMAFKLFGEHTKVERFTGTTTSTLQVMDRSDSWRFQPFSERAISTSTLLYCDLHERIENALQKKVMIESDLAHFDAQTNKNLEDILERDQKENDEILAKFISQFVKFGEPPSDFRQSAQALRKTIAASIMPLDEQMQNIFQQWAEEPEIVTNPTPMPSTLLYCDLHERLEGALHNRFWIEMGMAHSDTQTNKNSKDILERDQKENDEILAEYISQFVKFGEPPHEFRQVAQAMRKTIAASIAPPDGQMQDIFQQWAEEPEIGGGPGSDSQLLRTMIAAEATSNNLVHHQLPRKLGIQRLLGHVVNLSKIHRPKWFKRGE